MIKVKCPKCGAVSETDKQSSFCKAKLPSPVRLGVSLMKTECNGFMVTQRDKVG